MVNWKSFKAVFILIGFSLIFTPVQSIPTQRKLFIVPPHKDTVQKNKLQTENKDIATLDLQSILLELLDILYEHVNYWQKKKAQAKKITWQQQIQAALDCLYNEIDYQAIQLATVTEWLNTDKQKRNKINLIVPHDCNTYKKEVLDRIAPYKIPSHLSQHWLKYSIGTVCAIGTLAYCHQNKESISAFAESLKEAARNFLRDYAYKPLINSYNIIFGNNTNAVGYHEKLTKELLTNYYAKNHPDKPKDEVEAIVNNCTKTLELPKDMQAHLIQQSEHPTWNALFTGQYIKLNQVLLQLELLRAQNIYQGQKLNLELMVAIPTALAGYGTYRAIKEAYHFMHPTEKNYAPIKYNLLSIERVLNTFNNPECTMTDQAKGKIIYWTHKLSQMEYLIPAEQRETFLVDLAELYSSELLIEQKLRTIERMYRTYL